MLQKTLRCFATLGIRCNVVSAGRGKVFVPVTFPVPRSKRGDKFRTIWESLAPGWRSAACGVRDFQGRLRPMSLSYPWYKVCYTS